MQGKRIIIKMPWDIFFDDVKPVSSFISVNKVDGKETIAECCEFLLEDIIKQFSLQELYSIMKEFAIALNHCQERKIYFIIHSKSIFVRFETDRKYPGFEIVFQSSRNYNIETINKVNADNVFAFGVMLTSFISKVAPSMAKTVQNEQFESTDRKPSKFLQMIFTRDIWSNNDLTNGITIQEVISALEELIDAGIQEVKESKAEVLDENFEAKECKAEVLNEKFEVKECKAEVLDEKFDAKECKTEVLDEKLKNVQLNKPKPIRETISLNYLENCVDAVDYSPDERFCAFVSNNCLKIYNINTKRITFTLRKVEETLKFSPIPGSNLLVVGGWYKKFILINFEAGRILKSAGPFQASVKRVSFSSNGRLIAVGMSYGHIAICNIEGSVLYRFQPHPKVIKVIQFCPNREIFASGSQDKGFRVFSLKTYEKVFEWYNSGKGYVLSGSFSPDGLYWVTGDTVGFIRIYNVETQRLLGEHMVHQGWVNCVLFSTDGSMIFTCSKDRSIAVVQKETGKVLKRVNMSFEIYSMALNHDGTRLLYGGKNDDSSGSIKEILLVESKAQL
eukprot:TRINITY_DN3311_c2_g12_i1.p1 TRINITY_DN3311_c2_g12~~TRINITY_DN3311_c2_g12_i1.p1  ORF type:complete len:562 (+),score=123.88 TRINITY_DN3311_c2_g12_i1:1358-3043(+)